MSTNITQEALVQLLHEAIKENNYSRIEYLEAEVQAKNPKPEEDFFSDRYITGLTQKS